VTAQKASLQSRPRYLELLFLLGALQAFAPLSIDMYLPAMPVIEKVFHTSTAAVQLTMVTFLIGYALGQQLYGPLADRFGRKPPLYGSLVVFIGASAACALSPSIPVMAVARLVQAMGACGGAVMARAMVTDFFPARDLRRIFSMLVLVLGVSPVVAPLIGSYLLVWFGWNAAYITQALMGILCLAGMHFRLPESLPHESRHPLRLNVIRSTYRRLVKDRTFLAAAVVCGFSSAGTFAYITSAPFVFIVLYKVPTERFGWLFGSIAAGMVVASQINGRMPHRIPLWRVLRIANIVQFFAGLLLVAIVFSGIGGMWSLFACVFVFVSAQGFVFPNGAAIAMMRHGDVAGTASAMLGTTQFLIAAGTTSFLGFLNNPSLPMSIVIVGSAAVSTLLNFLTLGPKLETVPQAAQHTA